MKLEQQYEQMAYVTRAASESSKALRYLIEVYCRDKKHADKVSLIRQAVVGLQSAQEDVVSLLRGTDRDGSVILRKASEASRKAAKYLCSYDLDNRYEALLVMAAKLATETEEMAREKVYEVAKFEIEMEKTAREHRASLRTPFNPPYTDESSPIPVGNLIPPPPEGEEGKKGKPTL